MKLKKVSEQLNFTVELSEKDMAVLVDYLGESGYFDDVERFKSIQEFGDQDGRPYASVNLFDDSAVYADHVGVLFDELYEALHGE